MELKTQLTQNGQEIFQDDFNTAGESGALADDRLLAELLRLAPDLGAGVVKAVLPYGAAGDAVGYQGTGPSTVTATGSADATVKILPFRAVVGTRTLTSADALKCWRDIRSAVFVGGGGNWSATPPTSLIASQVIAANASGQARWDLIYAIVTIDANANSVVRAVKNSTSGAVTTPTIATKVSTQVTLGYLQGAASPSPVVPVTPADSASVYNIVLAYVLVPNGFGAASIVAPWMILPMASPGPAALSRGLGGANLSTPNAIVQSTSALASWANTSTVSTSGRPVYALSPEGPRGQESLLVAINIPGANTANWSHVSGALIDNSRDWRGRLFRATVFAGVPGPPASIFAWSRVAATTQIIPAPQKVLGTPDAANTAVQMGQSFVQDNTYATTSSTICFVNNVVLSTLAAGGVGLYVDNAGALRVYIGGSSNNNNVFFWVESTGPMPSW